MVPEPASNGRLFICPEAGRRGERRAPARVQTGMNLNYLISIVWFVLWILALVDCLRSNNPNKLVWVIVIILLPILGSILYFILGKSSRG